MTNAPANSATEAAIEAPKCELGTLLFEAFPTES